MALHMHFKDWLESGTLSTLTVRTTILIIKAILCYLNNNFFFILINEHTTPVKQGFLYVIQYALSGK